MDRIGQDTMLCRVYSFDQTAAEAFSGNYHEVLIDDVDNDGLSELVLCTKSTASRPPMMALAKYISGRIDITSEAQMPSGLTGYAQISQAL
jgi:hypothetical protein